MMKKSLLICSLALLTFASCKFQSVKGDGNVVSKNFMERGFRDLDVSSSFKIYLIQGAEFSIKVDAEKNILDLMEVHKEGDKLKIGFRDNINVQPGKPMVAYITAPEFRDIDISGASTLISEHLIASNHKIKLDFSGACEANLNIEARKIEIDASGASKISLTGKTKDFSVDASGASSIYCFNLITENTSLSISGGGDAEIFVSNSLKVDISGAGSVQYKGTPQSIKQDISGAGSIQKVD